MIRLFEGVAVAEAYALARPTTPARVAELSMEYLSTRNKPSCNGKQELMVDVGCGGGQSTGVFASYFNKIIGIDPSSEQIKMAKLQNMHENIVFREGSDEKIPVEKETVDLITCGQSAHWFNFSVFFKECHRVLKPSGCLVIHGYDVPRFSPHQTIQKDECNVANQLVQTLYNTCTFHPRRKHIDDHYGEIFGLIKSPHKSRNDAVVVEKECNLEEFVSYLTTWSGYRSYMDQKKKELAQQHGKENVTESMIEDCDIVAKFVRKLQKELSIETVNLKDVAIKVAFDIFVITSERPLLN